MRKAAFTLFAVSICLLVIVMLVGSNKKEDKSDIPKAKCEDCGVAKPEYCLNYKTDKEAYYCFDCYWENHWFEKNVTQIAYYDKWWE